jgi:glycine reductase complex component B subunit alpha and beta
VIFLKLELGYIFIKDIQFAEVSKVENGTLYVNKEEVKKNNSRRSKFYIS